MVLKHDTDIKSSRASFFGIKLYTISMKKGLIFIIFIAFFATFGGSFVYAEGVKTTPVEQKTDSPLSTIEKLSDLAARTQIAIDRLTAKGFDTTNAETLLQNATNTLTIAHDGLVTPSKDPKNVLSLKKAQELIKTAKQSLIDSLTELKTITTDTTKAN